MILKCIKTYIEEKKQKAKQLMKKAQIAIIQIENYENNIYNKIQENYVDVGFVVDWYIFPKNIVTEELFIELKDLQEFYDFFLLPSVLPEHIDANKALAAIPKEKNVMNNILINSINNYLNDYDLKLNIVLVGQKLISLIQKLVDKGATVTLCHEGTNLIHRHLMFADLIICAADRPDFLSCTILHGPIIDAGGCYNTEKTIIYKADEMIVGEAIDFISRNLK